ncbi:Uncharacterised protein [Myroides odoratimimus]|uniref:hypothetical protein n=1 Tax=Myroides odoratimimus TaxID=76832 RepID=UPI00073E44DD|nr:hypothetical protein [Myroides odoratimimus]STZ48157.1 Uncharacterised protein [Myroides odoratimimus]
MTATKQQKFRIRKNCGFNEGIKEEFVQWATEDNSKTSLNDLSYEQAERILNAQEGNREQKTRNRKKYIDEWEVFDSKNKQHSTILSLLWQLKLVHEVNGRDVADMTRFALWLKSSRSPVQKPLKKMTKMEVSRIIGALQKMTQKRWD